MDGDSDGHGLGDDYDVRRRPRRGVRVRPLPREYHRRFGEFADGYRAYVRSHLDTWLLADREVPGDPIVVMNILYWRSVLRSIPHMEDLATRNAPRRGR